MNERGAMVAGSGQVAVLGYGAAYGVVPHQPFALLVAVMMTIGTALLTLPLLTAEVDATQCSGRLDDYVDLGEVEDR
jgi:hypothetical protein